MYESWGINYENEKAYRFMKAFSENKIPNSQIRSHWHKIFSTTQTFKDNKLHLVKTTINHMLQKWMMANFPNLHVWGIWRNPIKILESIITNNFQEQWYANALEELKPALDEVEFLKEYKDFLPLLDDEIKITAFLIAVRSHFFLQFLEDDKLINYEDFKEDANSLQRFLGYYNLSHFAFKNEKKDLNIIGKQLQDNERINLESNLFIDEIFEPLNHFKKIKFGN